MTDISAEMLNEAIDRITKMEKCFDELRHAAQRNTALVDKDLLNDLVKYYEGGLWMTDYELDERGYLPSNLKRGILSEDAVYDFLTDIVNGSNED